MDCTIIPLDYKSPKQVGDAVLAAFALSRSSVEYPRDIDHRYNKLMQYFSCERKGFTKKVSMSEVYLEGDEIRMLLMKSDGPGYVPTGDIVTLPANALAIGELLVARLG